MSTAVERDEVHKLLMGDLSVLPRDSMRSPDSLKWPTGNKDSKRRQQIQQNGNDGAVYEAPKK